MIRFAQILCNKDGQWFLQISKRSDLKTVDTSWQSETLLGDNCLTPDVDIEECLIPCHNHEHAMRCMAEHYKNEIDSHGAVC